MKNPFKKFWNKDPITTPTPVSASSPYLEKTMDKAIAMLVADLDSDNSKTFTRWNVTSLMQTLEPGVIINHSFDGHRDKIAAKLEGITTPSGREVKSTECKILLNPGPIFYYIDEDTVNVVSNVIALRSGDTFDSVKAVA